MDRTRPEDATGPYNRSNFRRAFPRLPDGRPMPILEAEHLTRTYVGTRGTIRALDDVSLSIEKGQLFAFLGRNGAGKTTFIRIASTLLMPTSGSIRLFGVDA